MWESIRRFKGCWEIIMNVDTMADMVRRWQRSLFNPFDVHQVDSKLCFHDAKPISMIFAV